MKFELSNVVAVSIGFGEGDGPRLKMLTRLSEELRSVRLDFLARDTLRGGLELQDSP